MANQRVKAPKGTATMWLLLEDCTILLDLIILGEKLHFYIYYGKKVTSNLAPVGLQVEFKVLE